MITNLAAKLIAAYPSANPTRDFRVQDDGDGRGPYIAFWDTAKLGPQPSEAELAALPDLPPADPLSAWDAITLKIAFNHENRVRALEGKSAVTVSKFKTAVRGLL